MFCSEGKNESSNDWFRQLEIYKLRRIKSVIEEEIANPKDLTRLRKDFVIFVDEHDVRRGTNFLQTFPGFRDMYKKWKAY